MNTSQIVSIILLCFTFTAFINNKQAEEKQRIEDCERTGHEVLCLNKDQWDERINKIRSN